jgi:hypothetical protein
MNFDLTLPGRKFAAFAPTEPRDLLESDWSLV